MKRPIFVLIVLAAVAVALLWPANDPPPAKPGVNAELRQFIEKEPQRFVSGPEAFANRWSAFADAEWKEALVPTCLAIAKENKDAAAKNAAVKLLLEARSWTPQAYDALLDVMQDENCQDFHLAAAEGFCLAAPKEALKKMATFHDHSDSGIRMYAAIAKVHLAGASDGELSLLLAGLEHSDLMVRIHVLQTLSFYPPQQRNAVPALVKALESSEDIVETSTVLRTLSKQKAQAAEVVAILTKQLRDPSPGVRVAACSALMGMGLDARPALDELRALLNDPDRSVSQFASFAIDDLEKAQPPVERSWWPLAGFGLLVAFVICFMVCMAGLRRRAKRIADPVV